MTIDRVRLVELVGRLIAGAYGSDTDLDHDMAEFVRSVPHPRASDLIYFWQSEFDHQPSAEEVVDRALSYRSLEL